MVSEILWWALLIAWMARNYFVTSFYSGYFKQKQINRGNDPKKIIREQFPVLWWLF